MRRRTAVFLLFGIAAAGCKRKSHRASAELLSVVGMNDPRAEAQLVQGFYSLEQDRWRWTARQFSVVLRPPPAPEVQNGARLELTLTVPDIVVKQLGGVTLSAMADRYSLAPETYMQAGDYVYARDIPADALGSGSVTVEFALDKAIPAGKVETRELGLIVTSAALVPKNPN